MPHFKLKKYTCIEGVCYFNSKKQAFIKGKEYLAGDSNGYRLPWKAIDKNDDPFYFCNISFKNHFKKSEKIKDK